MEAHERHVALDYAKLFLAFAATAFVIFFAVAVVWLVASRQNSKLYEADNVVCVSQPFAISCFERKPR